VNTELRKQLEELYGRQNFGIKMGLEVVLELLDRIGRPHLSFAAIHVAGTNGKGSVCAIMESALRQTGARTGTGLYTSPHLVRFNERIRVDGVEISDAELGELFADMRPAIERTDSDSGRKATFFECATAIAFEHFRRKGVRIAVLETGMGGRLDATNVVEPAVSVITPISIEHTRYLGPDMRSIAREKAGIIKKGRPVVTADQPDEAFDEIRKAAAERGSLLVSATEKVSVARVSVDPDGQKVRLRSEERDYGMLHLALHGRHQLGNLATAVAALEVFNSVVGRDVVTPDAVRAGAALTVWPARLQVLNRNPMVVLDGAHNPGGARTLAEAVKDFGIRGRVGLIIGMCEDKDISGFCGALARVVRRAWAVPLRTERGLPPSAVARACRDAGWDATEASLDEAVAKGIEWAAAEGTALFMAGSLYLAGEVLEKWPKWGFGVAGKEPVSGLTSRTQESG